MRLFGELRVTTRDSDMSFAASCAQSGLEVQQPRRQRLFAQGGTCCRRRRLIAQLSDGIH